jgi:cold shock CspA family protein
MAELRTTTRQDSADESGTRYTGRVKWFNVKHGYGFISPLKVYDLKDDIFVHHSSINVGVDQYKYLTEGEYVDFNLGSPGSTDYKYHAVDVTGISREFLLCETKFAANELSKKRSDDRRQDRSRSLSPTTPRASREEEFKYPSQKRTVSKAALKRRS